MLGIAYIATFTLGLFASVSLLYLVSKATFSLKLKRMANEYVANRCQGVYKELKKLYDQGGVDKVLSSGYFKDSWDKSMEKKGNLSTLLFLAGWNGTDEPTYDEIHYAMVIYLEYLENSISKVLSSKTLSRYIRMSRKEKGIIKKNSQFLVERWRRVKEHNGDLNKVFACLVF